MQTLQIDFESTFEALPGLYVLLNNDAPAFTIASISAEYAAKVCMAKNEARGKRIFEMQLDCEFAWDESLLESLKTVAGTGLPHSFHHRVSKNEASLIYHIVNTPVLSQAGDVTSIIHQIVSINDLHFETRKPTVEKEEGLSIEAMIHRAPVAIAITRGADFVIERANEKMLELWAKSESIIGKPLLEALPEIADQPFPILLKSVLESGKEYTGTETKARLMRHGAMQEVYFNFVYSPISDSNGTVTGIMMIASEVTGLVMARRELEESEKRYRDLIMNATVATAVYVGEEMIVQIANDEMLSLWGKDRSVINKRLRDAVPELEGQPFLDLLQHVYKTGETYYSNEDRADLVVDGKLQTFYFNFTYKALYDTAGKIYGILNMAVDVSDIVKAKMALHESEERWRTALQSAELGTWDYFPSEKRFICSERTKVLFGIDVSAPEKFEDILAAIDERDRDAVAQEIRKSIRAEGGAHYQVEYRVIVAGKTYWHRTAGQAFYNANGDAYRLTGTVLDITERKRIQEALEERVEARTAELIAANRELERSNRELEQYAYVASHDLQEPLRKILVYSDLLKRNVPSGSTSNEERLEKIIQAARRMTHLIQDLLNFSRLMKAEHAMTSIDLNEVMQNVLEDFELTIEESGAEINIQALPTIEGSFQEMSQLFHNLISNALKFCKEDLSPAIHIGYRTLSRKEVQEFKELNNALTYYDIFVRDNGIGFDEKYSSQIFEIFKRLNTRSKFSGTGIGLAVCQKIAGSYQGLIYSKSIEGEGSVFHVVLPARQNRSQGWSS
ncbi:MAG TPA: PAS domain-containing protein [Chryseosolibacter sp.]